MKNVFFLAALCLAGCGGEGRDHPISGAGAAPAGPSPAAAPTTAGTAFFSGVPATLGKMTDGEPLPLDAVAARPAVGLEPQPLQ